jgi:hypothetical protein
MGLLARSGKSRKKIAEDQPYGYLSEPSVKSEGVTDIVEPQNCARGGLEISSDWYEFYPKPNMNSSS